MGEKQLDRFLTLEEAMHFLGGMAKSTLEEKVRHGIIPAYKPGRHLVFDPKELREFVKRRKVRP